MSAQETLNDHYNNRPGRPVDGLALLFNERNELLILKPTYKSGWMLVGGCSERNETVIAALQREVREEINLTLPSERFALAGVRDVVARGGRDAYTQVYFRAKLTNAEASRIQLQTEEVAEHRFVTISDLGEYADRPRMQAVVALLSQKESAYLVNESVATLGDHA